MHVTSKKKLREFWENPKHPQVQGPLLDWYKEVSQAE